MRNFNSLDTGALREEIKVLEELLQMARSERILSSEGETRLFDLVWNSSSPARNTPEWFEAHSRWLEMSEDRERRNEEPDRAEYAIKQELAAARYALKQR